MKIPSDLKYISPGCLSALALLLLLTSCKQEPSETSTETNNLARVLTLHTEDSFPQNSMLTTQKAESGFAIVENSIASDILVSESDHKGVQRIAGMFQKDLEHVSGKAPELIVGETHRSNNLIIVGTMGKSTLIDGLAQKGKIDVSELEGKWEQFLITPVKNPMEGVDNALVIVGSDKRGTIFGMFDLSEQMGVSPWYWWADVPIKVRENIYAKPETYTLGEPKVKYRGIFINDEAPALWLGEMDFTLATRDDITGVLIEPDHLLSFYEMCRN